MRDPSWNGIKTYRCASFNAALLNKSIIFGISNLNVISGMKMLFNLLAALFAFSIVCFACSGGKGSDKYESLKVDDFESLLDKQEVQLVDVRTGVEYSEKHIPGAVNINIMDDSFALHVDSLLQKDIPVAVYCRSGKRSRKAAGVLSKKGFKVYNLDKGILAWEELGKPLEK